MLTPKQRKTLKGFAHNLKPVVMVGKNGLEDKVYAAIDKALNDHELIKIKLLDTVDLGKDEVAETIAEKTQAELVTVIGKTIILYKANEEPRLILE